MKKICPTANFLVKYTKKGTNNALQGDEVVELTAANYGRDARARETESRARGAGVAGAACGFSPGGLVF